MTGINWSSFTVVKADGTRAQPPRESSVPGGKTHEIQGNDSFWSVAKEELTQAWGREPTNEEVDAYAQQLQEANKNNLPEPGNPDLLWDGQVIDVPPAPRDPNIKATGVDDARKTAREAAENEQKHPNQETREATKKAESELNQAVEDELGKNVRNHQPPPRNYEEYKSVVAEEKKKLLEQFPNDKELANRTNEVEKKLTSKEYIDQQLKKSDTGLSPAANEEASFWKSISDSASAQDRQANLQQARNQTDGALKKANDLSAAPNLPGGSREAANKEAKAAIENEVKMEVEEYMRDHPYATEAELEGKAKEVEGRISDRNGANSMPVGYSTAAKVARDAVLQRSGVDPARVASDTQTRKNYPAGDGPFEPNTTIKDKGGNDVRIGPDGYPSPRGALAPLPASPEDAREATIKATTEFNNKVRFSPPADEGDLARFRVAVQRQAEVTLKQWLDSPEGAGKSRAEVEKKAKEITNDICKDLQLHPAAVDPGATSRKAANIVCAERGIQ